MADGLFEAYERLGFCEVFDGASARPHYGALIGRLEALGSQELAARSDLVGTILRRQGITFNVYGHQDGHGADVAAGPRAAHHPGQRVGAPRARASHSGCASLDLFLDDLYVGERTALRDGVVPAWLVESSPGLRARGHRHPGAGSALRGHRASTWCATSRAPTGCWRTTCGCPRASRTCSRTGPP